MKNKNVAAILALTLGLFGVHRFYLQQTGLGVLYILLLPFFGFSALLGVIDALRFLTMDKEDFDFKYNRKYMDVKRRYPHDTDFDRRDRDFRRGYREERRDRRESRADRRQEVRDNRRRDTQHEQERTAARRKPQSTIRPTANPFRQEGVQKFKDFDYIGAIEAFEKALEINPNDIAVHFNLACSYSLTENKSEAFYHIDKAVAYGFKDFKRIREHDALAWLRIQDEFAEFAANNFRFTAKNSTSRQEPDLLETRPDLLDQIKKLSELRKKGFLTEAEFAAQKRKLMG